MELVRRGRKSKDDSPLENSASDSRRKKSKSKSKPKDKSKSKESKARRHEESSEDSDSSGEEYIVTKRNRYRDVDQRELPEGYAEAILRIFQVQPSKLERWCDAGYIRLDTKENCFNCDPVIEMAGKAERQEWVIFEKKYKRQIKEVGGEAARIRFYKGQRGGGHATDPYPGCPDCWSLGYHCRNHLLV